MDKRVFWYSVIASVIASIAFSWMLEPVTRWLWNFASDSASSTLARMQNAAFLNAAIGKRDWVTVAILLNLSLVVWGGVFGMGLGIYSRGRQRAAAARFGASIKTSRWKRVALVGALVVGLLGVLYTWSKLTFFAFVDLQLNASFSQRLDALGPYIDIQEERRLKSAWALMANRDDYEKINKRMDDLAKVVPVEIPAVLYK